MNDNVKYYYYITILVILTLDTFYNTDTDRIYDVTIRVCCLQREKWKLKKENK